ncbi:hybrid sensor histidine kinase/response regulator [Cupriavidus basilensis]|uniref:hybrid sensor histidine kinase/response regulator n=1 Tax=Cupriavidus basilensis TaxID=68895 RepID=UPI00157AAB33|nr:Hpt domain-containing protein [Cupriavidus basilensis]NUA29415.1 response regulator [Cupriavidus basilensis]
MSLNFPVSREAAGTDPAVQDPLAPIPSPDLSAELAAPARKPAAPVARDLSVLAWLAPSLRAALDDAAAELGHYVDEVQQAPEALGARDTTSLRLAGQHLHQAAGAVHIVGLRGVDPYCQALRRLLEGIDGGAVPADARTLAAFRLGVQALAEYVDDLMVGDDEDPVRLFCSYADVLGRLGEDRVHPADLWVDELQMLPGILLPMRMAATVTRARQRFEAALLKALRLPVPCAEPSLLHEAYLPLESALEDVRASEQELRRATDHPDRGVWHVLALVFGALAHGLLPSDLLAKRLAGRAHLLLRQYLQGQVRVPQALLNDAVYLLVTTSGTPPADEPQSAPVLVLRSAIRECLQAFRIDAAHATVHADFRVRYYGWLDPIDTRNLQQAATAFERAAAAGPDHGEWHNALAVLAEAAQPLAQPALLRCLDAALQVRPGADDPFGASAIALFLGRALALPWRVHGSTGHEAAAEFARRCDELTSYLGAHERGEPGAQAPRWLAQMVDQARTQRLREAAVAQLRGHLDSGESWLDAYDRDAARAEAGAHLRDAERAFAALAGTLAGLREAGALPEALQADALAVAAALERVMPALEWLAGARATQVAGDTASAADAVSERAGRLAAIAGELGVVHAFIDALAFGRAASADMHADAIDVAAQDEQGGAVSHATLLARARAAANDAMRHPASADAPEVKALRAALQAMNEQAAIDDAAGLRRQAGEATTQLNAWLAGSHGAAERLVVALAEALPTSAPGTPAPAPAAAMPAAADTAAIDAELLDIFLTEAIEVLGEVANDLGGGLSALADADTISRLRRAFHTLKGSSRMVGLHRYGEAAWAIEQVMNLWIAEARAPAPVLLDLLLRAHDELSGWVNALRGDAHAAHDATGLLAAAQSVRAGEQPEPVHIAEAVTAPVHATGLELVATQPEDEQVLEAQPGTELEPVPGIQPPEQDAEHPAEAEADNIAAGDAKVIPFRFASTPAEENDHFKLIGPVRISLPLYNVYLQEADDLIRQFATDLSEWRHEGRPCPSELALRVAHTLQGSASTVGLEPVRAIAEALERLMLQLGAHPVAMHPGDFRLLEQAVERVRGMLHQFAAGIWPAADDTLCRSLLELGERAMVRPRLALPAVGLLAEAEDAPVALLFGKPPGAANAGMLHDATVTPLHAVQAQAAPAVTDTPDEQAAEIAGQAEQAPDPALVEIFLEEAHGSLPELGKLLRGWETASGDGKHASHAGLILRALHTLKGSARMAGAMALGQAAHEMETLLDAAVRADRVGPLLFVRLYAWYDRILAHSEALQAGRLLPVDDPELINAMTGQNSAPDEAPVPAAPTLAPTPALVQDVPPSATVQPWLPSAPMQPVGAPLPMPAMGAALAPATDAVERQRALVRVQARTLDTLITDAGEVGATRARLESELDAMRSYLGELNDNVARLRGQLREIEIQAESQMASRTADAQHTVEFDPLEFDRFTRFQELTRMMAESVNDVATVEQNLQRGFDRAAGDLDAQARLTRGLQRSLMQARMVQFDALAERLYRVARQAASETGKEVRLLIKGGTVEVDRSVLDRMAGPIEHLIRNAVVHGIESADVRRAAGKPTTGALTLEVQQEGNEVVLHFVDDGGGLDLARIRARAIERELLAPDDDAGDARLTEMIFAPGFSTADTVSELAGRGVGMDVVRAETVALGGRIALATQAGQGTRFTVHLPLTTAITQVLLVTLGGRPFAIPSGMIDQVQQLRSQGLLEAYNQGSLDAPGGAVPFRYLGTLLEETPAVAAGKKYSPVVVVRSGAERIAVHVDEVIGNREVVVKHIGPHLARLEGIAGATTLGDGEIVLIYNPVVLAQRFARERGELARPQLAALPHLPQPAQQPTLGAVAEFSQGGAAPVQGLATQPTIMVVDDSLTVRKVTHRLLTRAGYQVVLARDGVDALRQLQEVMPDAMLVDIEMPHMDGFDLTRNVRSDSRTAHMPLVMITSRTAEKHRRYAAEIGVNVYLGKPYNEDELLTTLQHLLGERAVGMAGSVAQMLGEDTGGAGG